MFPLSSGQFNLPVSCLKEPTAARLVRPVDRVFVECLKQEMLANPTTDVAPMIGLVRLQPGVVFDKLHPEAYTYETLGGNNSRTALAELLEENAELASDPRYSKRMVSVYCNLSDEESQLLAVKHNRQQSFVHQMTTQDKVCNCMLIALSLCLANQQALSLVIVHKSLWNINSQTKN